MFYFDPLYMIVAFVGLAFSLWATARVKSAFARYSRVPSATAYTGAQVARRILDQNGLMDVPVEPVGKQFMPFGGDGMLTDHYDPTRKVVRLSPQVYQNSSIAAQAIAAHECGHAVQHAKAFAPLMIRNAIVPVATFGSHAGYFIIFLGFIMHALALVKLGIILFAAAVVFQLITLPVEIDASRRGKAMLTNYGLISPPDRHGVSAVLNAAAWTYVAAAASAVLTLLYYFFRAGLLGGGRSDD